MLYDHFEGKSVDRHIIEKFSKGIVLSSEPHGTESSGSTLALLDALRTSAFLASLFFMFFPQDTISWKYYSLFCVSIILWNASRSAWLIQTRLNKLHRLLKEEKHEIETNRAQEREELIALYRLKGLDSPLVEEVADVLMADNERLLQVMLEEELGLNLGYMDHPLLQAAMASLGSFFAFVGVGMGGWIVSYYFQLAGLDYGHIFGALGFASGLIAASSASFSALHENQNLPSVIYSLATAGGIWAIIRIFMPI